jgi:hypothetical protein
VKRFLRGVGAVVGCLLIVPFAISTEMSPRVLLKAVSTRPTSFNPSAGDAATIRVSLARAATIDMQVVDRDGYVIRSLPPTMGAPGDNVIVWDGRDDRGEIVPDEAWSFRIIADGGADEFFPATKHAAMIAVDPLSFSRVTATLRYKLPVPSRVHVQAGTIAVGLGASSKGEGPVLRTIADREPRGAGFVAEHWNGFDASGSIYVPDLPGFAVAIAVTPLPEESVITFGNAKRPFLEYAAQRSGKSLIPQQPFSTHHAGLDVFHDLAPNLILAPAPGGTRTPDGVWTTADRELRLHVEADGPTARAFEGEPGKIFVFVDAQLVETRDAKQAREAFRVRLSDDAEHRITVNWRSDYGPVAVAVARIRVSPPTRKGTE